MIIAGTFGTKSASARIYDWYPLLRCGAPTYRPQPRDPFVITADPSIDPRWLYPHPLRRWSSILTTVAGCEGGSDRIHSGARESHRGIGRRSRAKVDCRERKLMNGETRSSGFCYSGRMVELYVLPALLVVAHCHSGWPRAGAASIFREEYIRSIRRIGLIHCVLAFTH
jgi:hypothetical protein